jgi:hypothetical protein
MGASPIFASNIFLIKNSFVISLLQVMPLQKAKTFWLTEMNSHENKPDENSVRVPFREQ